MRYYQILLEMVKKISWNSDPAIGWWLDSDILTLYHGTHDNNMAQIMEDGLVAPTGGPTAGLVSLALEPHTGRGYATMSGEGGETAFGRADKKAKVTPPSERTVLVLKIPKDYALSHMAPMRGLMSNIKEKLTDRTLYDAWKRQGKSDQEYYALTEIRLPSPVSPKFIVGYMKKG